MQLIVLNSCKVCGSTQRIERDHEIVCTCGVIHGTVDSVETAPTHTKITSNNQNKIGSKNLVDPKLNLVHIDKKRTMDILEKNNRYDTEFLRCCDILNFCDSLTSTAFHMFRKLCPCKLGNGKTAVFCIYYSHMTFEIVCDIDKVIQTVRCRFGLKRMITLEGALYSIKPSALALKLISDDGSLSDSFAIKKFVAPKHHVYASKILNCFSGKAQKKAKTADKYLRCYS